MISTRKTFLLLIMITLLAASLACNLPGVKRPDPGLPVTTEAAVELEQNIGEASEDFLNGKPFSLTVDETQATSLANLKLQSIQETRIQNLQIFLRDGQIQITGQASSDGFKLPVSLAVRVSAANGSIAYELLQAKVGPVSLPDSIMQEFEAQLDQIILNQLNPSATNVYIENITIANGVMTITGRAN